jgi:hypothetical protein
MWHTIQQPPLGDSKKKNTSLNSIGIWDGVMIIAGFPHCPFVEHTLFQYGI